jgi:riboflavin synthase alpha subunit
MSIYDIYRGTNDFGITEEVAKIEYKKREKEMLESYNKLVQQHLGSFIDIQGYICVNGCPVNIKTRIIRF